MSNGSHGALKRGKRDYGMMEIQQGSTIQHGAQVLTKVTFKYQAVVDFFINTPTQCACILTLVPAE